MNLATLSYAALHLPFCSVRETKFRELEMSEIPSNMDRHMADHFDQISLWYPPLKDVTFETAFIDITLDEGRAIKSFVYCSAVTQFW
jgi:hypothetical protein